VGSGTTAVTTTVTTDARGSVTAFSTGLISITGSAISTGPITALSYNNAGQLASASGLPGTLGVYIYDAFGNRFSKTVCSPSPAICNMQLATTFTYAPDGTLLEEVALRAPKVLTDETLGHQAADVHRAGGAGRQWRARWQ
jgi:hypothetical protein